ncbi:BofC C-terminal domain-containing protein [bacterium 210820-DFI.6.37]|nr:BofC C-terminal domain-containing protein [bacterium 210820-DFI.6.37]
MFSKQRKNFFKSKWFYGIIILLLLLFGIWVNYDGSSQKASSPAKVSQETQSETKDPSVVDSLGQETSENASEEVSEPTEESQQTYYLIREIEGVVKVFYCDENGQENLYQITSIPFELLSKEDQQLLAEGVHVDSEEELADFLENFDS